MSPEYDAIVVVHPLYEEANSLRHMDMSIFDAVDPKPDLASTTATRTFADPKYGVYKKNLKDLLENRGAKPAIQYEEADKFEKTVFLRESGLVDKMIPTLNKGYATYTPKDEAEMKKYMKVLLTGQVRDICVQSAKEQLEWMGISVVTDDKYIYDGWWSNPELVELIDAGKIPFIT